MRRLLGLLFPPKSASASIARERLKIVLSHERANRDTPDFLPALQKELLDVVSRYIEIRPDMIRINVGKSGETSLLEINVEIDGAKAKSGKTDSVAEAKPAAAVPAKQAPPSEVKPAEPKPAIVGAFEAGEPAPWVKPG
jgi:cell division topological specificity factor